MGAYLSEPMTQKESEDGEGNKLKFGACSMQGWRISQEDAHNCIAKFDENSSLFAVYDGHGGAEVAAFLSRHLPDMLKQCDAYKNGEFVKALEECYLKIDASIKTPEVLKEIQKLAKSSNKGDKDEAAVDYDEENVGQLYEEATMPLDKLVAKYAPGTHEGSEENATDEDPSCKPGSSKSMCSPGSSSSARSSKAGGSASSTAAAASSAGVSSSSNSAGGSSSSRTASSNVKVNGESSGSSSSSGAIPSEELKTETVSDDKVNNELELVVEGKKINLEVPKEEEMQVEENDNDAVVKKDEPVPTVKVNGESTADKENEAVPSAEMNGESTADKENEVVPPAEVNGGSTADKKDEQVPSAEVNGGSTADKEVILENGLSESKEPEPESLKSSKNGEQKSTPLVNGGGDNDSASPNGENAVAPVAVATPETPPRRKKVHPVPMVIPEEEKQEKRSSPRKTGRPISFVPAEALDCSDSEDSEEDAGYNLGDKDSEDSSELEDEEEAGEESDDDEDDDDEYEDEDEEEDERFLSEMQEPGYDSGATAVVCFMKWEADGLSLWVANAGDSRCVVCREGKAIDMSHDHKPELDVEALRIVKAGGKVTEDGRVNGGLNLSRALGDHSYKQNQTLPPEEQMISPLPSIENIVLNPAKDKFMVLACDGIWNSMSSQEVIDFVAKRLEKSEKLSQICEELFDTCLSPDTCGDGTGCDNMTCIIVKISDAPEIYSGSKRKLSSSETAEDVSKEGTAESTKKCRVEEAVTEESS